jgi:hypothetical protein
MKTPNAKTLGLKAYGEMLAAKRRKKLGKKLAMRLSELRSLEPLPPGPHPPHLHEDKCCLLR